MGNLVNNDYGSTTADNLIAGITHPLDTKSIIVASGQGVLKRGTVIGIITASKKAKKADSTSADGSQSANCILTDDIDTTSGDVTTSAYSSGLFNRDALVFGGADTAANHEATLRLNGIFLKDVQAYE